MPVAATSAGMTLGTIGYMSPEQVRGEVAGPASDIFGLGALLYEIAARRPAFRERTTVETLNAILKTDPSPLPPNILPPALERVIARCLRKDPADRFRSATDVAFALEALAPPPAARTTRSPARTRGLVLAAAGTLILIALALWLPTRIRQVLKPPATAGPAPAGRMTPFLSNAAIEKAPAWSPNGDLLAYVSDAAGNDDVWMVDPSGANPVNLTASFAGVDDEPAWSPDGRSLAFYSERDGGGIYTMTALGANVRRVVPLKSGILYTFSLNWARDGSLVYTAFDDRGLKQVFRVAAIGGAPSCLTCDAMAREGRAGELAPSGELLVFLSGETGPRASMHVKHLASGRVTQVANRADVPHWSAEGSRIVFISNRDGQSDLWELAINAKDGSAAGEPRRLTSALGATNFALSPDGRQILAVKEQSTSHLWSLPLMSPGPDLRAGIGMTSGEVRDRRSRWSGDGRSLFFESDRRGSVDIWRLETGGALARLTTDAGAELRPRPSRQGEWVAYDAVDARGEFTHLMRLDGSQAHPVNAGWFTAYRHTCCADWSPDGTRLALSVSTRSAGRTRDRSAIGVVTIDRASGQAGELRMLDLPGGAPEYARWSPDGRFIAYEALTDGSWDLWIVNPDNPVPRRLTNFEGNERSAAWQKEPLALLFRRDSREIWRLPMDAHGSPRAPAERWFMPPGRLTLVVDSLDVHPAGDRLMLTVATPASDIWLVEPGGR
jgi:Tol biopolymer transport system component